MAPDLDGSSPHTRGTLHLVSIDQLERRFIPAHAGNAFLVFISRPRIAVHPRTRGERGLKASLNRWRYGSSPHTRGTPVKVLGVPDAVRFIPAHAGNACL